MNKYITFALLVILLFLVGCQNSQSDHNEFFNSDLSLEDEDLDICYPDIIYEGKGRAIGSTEGTLYLSKDRGVTWYKENSFELYIEDVSILNDNIVIWDRVKDNFLYNLQTRKLTPYTYKKPLDSFFSYPIKSFEVYRARSYCLGGEIKLLLYIQKRAKRHYFPSGLFTKIVGRSKREKMLHS